MLKGRKRNDVQVIEVIFKDGSNVALVEGKDRFEILDKWIIR
jgi:hypothetical protein